MAFILTHTYHNSYYFTIDYWFI